jgi:hypothetical protein
MKIKRLSDGTFSARIMIGRTPEGKPIYKRIIADSPVELWKQHYLIKGDQIKKDAPENPDGVIN